MEASDFTNTNDAINYAWQGVDTVPTVARFASTGAETYTIASGSVTKISGTAFDGGTPAVNDPLLLKDCPAVSGVGSIGSLQPANGLYCVTAVGTDISVARAATMSVESAQPNPARRVVFVGPEGVVNGSSIFEVTTPIGDAVFSYGTTSMQWSKFELVPSSIPNPIRPQRNTIAVVGDSISALGSEGWYQPWLGHTWVNQLQVLSHQRIRYGGGNFSIAGTNISNQQTVQFPQILAMNPLPGACVLAVGTNDIQAATFDLNATATAVKAMVAALLAVGVAPILWCPPPNNHVGGVGFATVAQIHSRTYAWNIWVRRYAAENGFALVDAFTALAQSDGTAKTGTINASDLIHPTGKGARFIARQAIEDGLADIFQPNSLVNTARTTDDLSNMLNNGTTNLGLFTTDSNADGVADGLGASGSGYTCSLVAPSSSDQIQGNWQRSTVAAIGGSSLLAYTFSTGWSIGDVIAFSARIRTSGFDVSSGDTQGFYLVSLKTDTPSGFTVPDGSASLTFLWNGIYEWDSDIDDGELYVEFPIPVGATDLVLWMSVGSTTVATPMVLDVAEVTVRNLTTGGLLI